MTKFSLKYSTKNGCSMWLSNKGTCYKPRFVSMKTAPTKTDKNNKKAEKVVQLEEVDDEVDEELFEEIVCFKVPRLWEK